MRIESQQNRVRHGFTLVEILMVVIILGIASAVIVPNLAPRNDLNAAAAARVVMADLTYAQQQAIVTQAMQYVNVGTNTYSLLTNTPSTSPMPYMKNPLTLKNYTTQFGQSTMPGLKNATLGTISFNGKTCLAFDELGQPYSWDSISNTVTPLANPGSIVVQSGTFTMTVYIEPYTGAMSIQ